MVKMYLILYNINTNLSLFGLIFLSLAIIFREELVSLKRNLRAIAEYELAHETA